MAALVNMTAGIAIGAASLIAMAQPAATEISVYAAGSLRSALLDAARAFEATHPGTRLRFTFGASGLLKDRLLAGETADVFASANMEHPEALRQAGRADAPVRFARNSMCALVRPGLDVSAESLVQRMLDPAMKLGTSTPKADPSGDYAWLLFERIERSGVPGAFAALAGKALQLTGGPQSPPPPADRDVYGALVMTGLADIFITYCTSATLAVREQPGLGMVGVPASIAVAADYGLVVMKTAPQAAREFAAFLLGSNGRQVLAAHGFSPP